MSPAYIRDADSRPFKKQEMRRRVNCAHKQFMGMENAVTKMQLHAPELIEGRDLLCQVDMLVDGVRYSSTSVRRRG